VTKNLKWCSVFHIRFVFLS